MAPQLPGYYFDEEKKKYFKILPNHIAPSNAKYAHSNVKHEEHLAKKQKIENDHKRSLKSQTVISASVLKHPLLGNGLDREYGFRSLATSLIQREHASVRALQLQQKNTYCTDPILDAHWTSTRIALISTAGLSSVPADRSRSRCQAVRHFSTPNSQIVASCITTISETAYVLGCTDGQGGFNAFLTPLDDSERAGQRWHVQDSLVDCAVQENILAFAGERKMYTNSALNGQQISSLGLPERTTSSAIEWLGANTLAYGTCESRGKKQPTNHTVMLWDVRSPTATAARFTRPKRITGLSKPDCSGNTLIVTSNYEISLYDLRQVKADRPLLSIPHLSEGPVTYHDTHNGTMLAAVGQRQEIQAYSWRTGKHVTTLALGPHSKYLLLRNVRWYEDEDGPFLQVCRGTRVIRFGT